MMSYGTVLLHHGDHSRRPCKEESAQTEDKTINAVEEEENKDKNQSSKHAIKKDSKKR